VADSDSQDTSSFEKLNLERLPLDDAGVLKEDLFIHLPTAQRFVRFLVQGDEISDDRLNALRRHPDPALYRRKGTQGPEGPSVTLITSEKELPADLRVEVISKKTQDELKTIFKGLMDPAADPIRITAQFESQSEQVLQAVAPDTKNLRDVLARNVHHAMIMNDVAAMTTISVFVALAAGFDSKKSYRDLSLACLIMDASLSEFQPMDIQQYYADRSKLRPEILTAMLKHPIRSHQLAQEKLKSLSDVTMQLILNHHELFNGKGYPRGLRSESLFPMVKVMALAVDLYEHMKAAELAGQSLGLSEALYMLRDESVDPHMKRHSKKLIDQVITYYGFSKPNS
jgi:HD-GYP domain-containing protein (c-di-GMP phosphodiesterase class II)